LDAGESILTWKNDAVAIEVLVNACIHTVESKLLQFAKAESSYRFLVYAGHVITETGNWLLQDGTLSVHSFVKALSAGCGGTGPIDVATYQIGDWSAGKLAKSIKRARLIPEKSASSGSDADVAGFVKFASAVASHITVETVPKLLQGTDVIGVVPFTRPTLNVFQGGNGMSAMFGVRGFSMLVDTGYPRRTCSWDFLRHMGDIDIVMLPQIGESNILGAKSFVERLALGDVRTAIGQVFINAGQTPTAGKIAGDEAAAGDSAGEKSESLLLSISEVSTSAVECLAKCNILCAPCAAKLPLQPVNLYHKIGFGSLDMYILNPISDSKDLKEFLAGWGKTSKPHASRLNDLVSVSTVVAFRPEIRSDHPVRMLFPGSSPVIKLYEGLERLKTNPLFQSADGTGKPAAQKAAGDKGTGRPGTGSGKPGTARPVMTPRDAQSKTAAKTGSKVATESSTSAVESKKTASESAAAKTRDRKTPRDAKPDVKSEGANQKDAKAHPKSSTPKKDGQKPAAKSDASAAKGTSAPPANKTQAKTMPSPIGKKTRSPGRDGEKSADAKAEVPAADKPELKPDDVAVSDSNADVIPELIPCTTEQDIPVVSEVESQAVMEPQDRHLVVNASAAAVNESGSVQTEIDGASGPPATGESAVNLDSVPQAAAEVDPIQSWDPPQGLPAPSDDKAIGSMPPSDSDRRGTAGKSAPKDRASATASKRGDRPPPSARAASSASTTTKKPAPARAVTPFYFDLAYIPTYAVGGCDAEFFHHVRSRYYILPGSSADPRHLSALADAKSAWEGELTVIPTGNTDALIAWVMAHRDELTSLKIEVTPSVARSTLQLDRGSTCAAYRLEF